MKTNISPERKPKRFLFKLEGGQLSVREHYESELSVVIVYKLKSSDKMRF